MQSRASRMGAKWALWAGLSALLGLGKLQEVLGLSGYTSAEIGLATLGIAMIAMVVGSLLFPDPKDETESEVA